MSNIFFISDTHFGHANTTNGRFTWPDGTKLRPFDSVEEMDEAMVENWNAVVRDCDKVYHLGDVVIKQKNLEIIRRLRGKKRLIRGNHDIFKTAKYVDVGFKEVYGVRVLEDCVLSHIPLHPDSITERFGVNVHGHLHANRVHLNGRGDIDPRYVSVCVEQIDYAPLHYDDLRARIRQQFEYAGQELPRRGWGNGSRVAPVARGDKAA